MRTLRPTSFVFRATWSLDRPWFREMERRSRTSSTGSKCHSRLAMSDDCCQRSVVYEGRWLGGQTLRDVLRLGLAVGDALLGVCDAEGASGYVRNAMALNFCMVETNIVRY